MRVNLGTEDVIDTSLTTLPPPQQRLQAFLIGSYMLRANIELADSMDESADDMTAADTAPRPMMATGSGVKYCITSGSTSLESSAGIGISPW